MEMILTAANVAGGMIAGVMSVALFELIRVLTGWKVDGQVAALRWRMADVEALSKVRVMETELQCRNALKEAGCTCQRWPSHQANDCPLHGDADEIESPFCDHCGTAGWGSDHDEECPANPTRGFDPEEVSDLPAVIAMPNVTSREQAERLARYRRKHGGYPDVSPSIIGEHLGDRPICDETEGDCS